MFDWQTIAVALIIVAAFAYVARRALARLGSFRVAGNGSSNGSSDASCATGCGSCGDGEKKTRATMPAKVLVQIGRAATTSRTPRRQQRMRE
ncbi:MAG TPA: FeoB-associated Cys-rich membrane protein [Pyrinomonadaceae bacterium]|jgi:hypothetical protein